MISRKHNKTQGTAGAFLSNSGNVSLSKDSHLTV